MTIIEAITAVDDLCPNTYSRMQKIRWLSDLDGIIKTNVIDTHEGGEHLFFDGYDEKTDMETELLAPHQYGNMYLLWLEAKMHFADGETIRFNNTNALYSAEYAAMCNYYNRTHMPKGEKMKYF